MSYVEIFEGLAARIEAGHNPHEAIRAFAVVANIPERALVQEMANRAAQRSRQIDDEARASAAASTKADPAG